ncbi:MAG: hypothetical protein ACR2OD_04230 [Gaiellaceae bacterium]
MRGIWLLVSACAVALIAAGCGTTLGSKEEGSELLPGAPLLADQPQEPGPPAEPLALDEIDPTLEPLPLEEFPEEQIEPEEEAEPVNPFEEAVRLLLRGKSVRMAVTATSEIPGTGREFRVRSDGFFDVRSFAGAIDVDASNLTRRLGQQGTLAAGYIPGQIVFGDKTVYLNYENLPAAAPGQLPWAAAKYRQLFGAQQWPDQGTVSGLALTTPAHVVALLTATRNTFVEIGGQPIRGATSTHYQATVDLGKLAAAAPEAMRGVVRTQSRALAAELGTSELPIDVWLDAKGRLRRVQIDLGAAAALAPPVESPADEEPAPAEEPAPETPAADPAPEGSAPATTDAATPDESQLAPDDPARTLEGEPVPAEPVPPNVVLVVDFITFGGRVRAPVPAEEETGVYANVTRLARTVFASLVG